ncbi:HD-GYP domain-containing protein [Gemmatimonas sp.]|uniref:HD-GYP domain-containing protein n=1 Tax=Gemmatimonas sp. TaxID=1962908 RepID=UPI00391F0EAD
MTAPHSTTRADRGTTDGGNQKTIRALIVAMNSAVRAVRLYPVENTAVQKAIAELGACADRVRESEGHCTVRRVGDYLFVNDTRLRLTFDNYAAVAALLGLFREAGIGGVGTSEAPPPRSWVVLLSFLQAPPLEYPEEERLTHFTARLETAQVHDFELLPAVDDQDELDHDLDAKERARQTYVRSLDVTREVLTSARLGKSPGLKRVKRAVQGIVDAILTDGSSMIGLTTLRDFDEYTFVHSVNVCILSVALGRRLALSKTQLLDLGLAALLHDIGKSRVPRELLNKRGHLAEDEQVVLWTHTWNGVLALFALTNGGVRPWRAMTAAYEHHMKTDLSGYPKVSRQRKLSLFSKIIAVTDGFDAATTTRVYQDAPWSPADVLRGMRDNPRLGLDPVVVKAFINLTGIYPVGTVVVLDTFELAIVLAANPDPSALSRPIIRLLMDDRGNLLDDPNPVDLTVRTATGQFARTIIRTEDPQRYGINIGDYFA